MHRGALVACVAGLSACGGELGGPGAPAAPRTAVASLWDLAPHDASSGVVLHDGTPGKMLAYIAMLDDGPARKKVDEAAKKHHVEPLPTLEGWGAAGLDPSLGAAAFGWADKERGALLVLPVRDREAFRRAFKYDVKQVDGRTFDELPQGYLCAPAAGRYVCSKRVEDIAEAATTHASPLARAFRALPAADHGDVETYADLHVKDVAQLAERVRPLGRLTGVAAALHLRIDGVSARVHLVADQLTPFAYAFRGKAPPPSFRAAAASSPTIARFSVDPTNIPPDLDEDEDTRSELLDRFTGDVEMSTSGHGLAGLFGVAPISEPRRVEAFVKKTCAEQNGSRRSYALRDIAVTPHGCSARFDPSMLLLPVKMKPLPVAASIEGATVVFTVGDATPPAAPAAGGPRPEAYAAEGTEAARTLADPQTAAVFTRSPWIGPDVGAGAAFHALVSLVDDKSMSNIEAFSDLAAHVAQAALTARMEPNGFVVFADLVTFARDPGPAREAYGAAIAFRTAGDVAGYRKALADVEERFPSTLAGQRVRDVRDQGPWLGAGMMFLSSLGDGFSHQGKKDP